MGRRPLEQIHTTGIRCDGGRFLAGIGFRRSFLALSLVQAATMSAYLSLASTRLGFAAGTVLMLFCMGGNFAMFPAQTMRMRWAAGAAAVYGVMFSAFGLAALGGPSLSAYLASRGGPPAVFRVLSAASLLAAALATVVNLDGVEAKGGPERKG